MTGLPASPLRGAVRRLASPGLLLWAAWCLQIPCATLAWHLAHVASWFSSSRLCPLMWEQGLAAP